MEFNYYVYKKLECAIKINKIPKWYLEAEYEGEEKKGYIHFHSQNEFDEIWGPSSKLEINWENKDKLNLFYYKEVQNSIDIYNAIGLVITQKNQDWLRSHEFTIWFGNRKRMIRKRFYVERAIHGIFYCDSSERLFNIHATVIDQLYENFKPYILNCFKSIVCHE